MGEDGAGAGTRDEAESQGAGEPAGHRLWGVKGSQRSERHPWVWPMRRWAAWPSLSWGTQEKQ